MSKLLSVRTGSRVTFKRSSINNLRKSYNQNAQPCQPLLNRWNSTKVQEVGLQKMMVDDVKSMQSKVNTIFPRNIQRRNIHQQSRFSEKEKLTAVQMNLNYHKLAETQEKNTNLLSDLTAWILHKAKVPKGK